MAIRKSIGDAIIRRFDRVDQKMNGKRRIRIRQEREKFLDDLFDRKAKVKGTRFGSSHIV